MSTLTEIREHLETINKSMGKIYELAKLLGEDPVDCKQARLADSLETYAGEGIDENATIDALVQEHQTKEKT